MRKVTAQKVVSMIRKAVELAKADTGERGAVYAVAVTRVRQYGQDFWEPYVGFDETSVSAYDAMGEALERRWAELAAELEGAILERRETVYGPTIYGIRDKDRITVSGPVLKTVEYDFGFAGVPEGLKRWWER